MPTLTEQAYEGLIREIFPQVEISSIRPEASGWASFVLEVNGDTIFRFPMRSDVEVELRKEIRLLSDLALFLDVPVPNYEYVWEGNDIHPLPFVGYRKIEGIHPHEAIANHAVVPMLASSLGTFLGRIHSYPKERAISHGVPGFTPEEWWRVHARFGSDAAQIIQERVSEDLWNRINGLWQNLRDKATNSAFEPTFVHNDAFSSHFFCDAASGKLTGVIDWGDAATGDPAKDFGGLLYDCGEHFTKQVIEAYIGVTGPTFWDRVRLYGYRIHFAEILYAFETKADRLGKLVEYLISDTIR